MNIKLKAWDKKKKKMLYPHSIPMQPGECSFGIDLSGAFVVLERSRLTVSNVHRDPRDFKLLPWLGLTSKDNKKLFPGDIIQDIGGNKMTIFYGQYKSANDSWGVAPTHFGCYISFDDGGTLALTQSGGGYSIAAGECNHIGHIYEQ